LTPSPERIFLGDMKLSDVFKLLEAVEEGLKKWAFRDLLG
jgi:hypothetical protein